MKVKTKCYFCNQKELEVEIPHDFDLRLGPGPENLFDVQCECYKKYSHVKFASTCYYYDGAFDYKIHVELGRQTFFFFYLSDGCGSQSNTTELGVRDNETRKYSNLGIISGHWVTLENCYEKLQKYIPFI